MSHLQPSLFVPHGAPTFALRPGAAGAALRARAQTLELPRAVVVISAHWETAVPTVGFADRPETIHDFYGFPEALYALNYPATGCREAAETVLSAIEASGLPVERDERRGLDHGAWVPLRLMFPEANVPVVPLSIQPQAGAQGAWRLGQALAPLTGQGFLIIGSGSITHNLRDYQMASQQGGQTPPYVREFADWLAARAGAGEIDALLDYRRQSAHGVQAHPRDEHLLPFFVSLGAGGRSPQVERFYAGIDDYVIAMDAYSFLPKEGGRP